MKTLSLFVLTALAEIVGCYLPWLWLVEGVRPTVRDGTGAAVALVGMGIIKFQPTR